MSVAVLEEQATEPLKQTGGSEPPAPVSSDSNGGHSSPLADPGRLGLLAFLATVSMFFMAFTSAYVFRRAAPDWAPLTAPPLLWLNTGLLVLSSLSLEAARRALRTENLRLFRVGLAGTGLLGVGFVLGQWAVWSDLAQRGIFVSSHPHSSFFYALTGLHVAHMLGGFGWYLAFCFRLRNAPAGPRSRGLGLFATYWHYLGGLWIYLLLLLFVF